MAVQIDGGTCNLDEAWTHAQYILFRSSGQLTISAMHFKAGYIADFSIDCAFSGDNRPTLTMIGCSMPNDDPVTANWPVGGVVLLGNNGVDSEEAPAVIANVT
jgi:hypothetical protein